MDTSNNKKISVYYVEDEVDLIELCKIAFQISGFEMRSSSTGEDAMQEVKKIINKEIDAPDAFILDVLLPGISGMEIMREIRKHPELNKIPIIIFTNFSDGHIKEEAQKTINTGYILKTDIVPTQLVKIVAKKIEEARMQA